MSSKIDLDRSFKLDISYPIGVKETLTLTNEDEVTLTDNYQIVIVNKHDVIVETILIDGTVFIKVDNKLIWNINYEYGDISISTYNYEIQNLTQDWNEFKGLLTVTKTIE